MDLNQLQSLREKAIHKMDLGDFESALTHAYEILDLGPHFFVSYTVSGLLIDVGRCLNDEAVVNQGIDLLQNDLKTILQHAEIVPSTYYNLANGYCVLSQFKLMNDQSFSFFKETELNKAKFYFRKALEFDLKDNLFKSQVLVNLGNCYEAFGRVFDALECYEKALKYAPDHGMALGNKGLAIEYYSELAGEHQKTYLLEAHSLLSKALKAGVDPETVNNFSQHIECIEKIVSDKRLFDNPPVFPGYTIKARSKFEKYLIKFCLEHGLYLNTCSVCNKCDAAIGDTVVIKEMLVPANSDQYLRLSTYLNQIKQDYVTARFLLILSRYRGLNLKFVDKNVTIIDTLDQSVNNIYTQLIKESFKSFYNILDKIACFTNDYLHLGLCKNRTYFGTIWYSDWKTKKVRKKIENTKNTCLNALFDIYQDFENGPYNKLRKTRNALTHRFVNIRRIQEIENEENMTEEVLFEQTIDLAKIVKNAIIYLLYFVHWEEQKKLHNISENPRPIFSRKVPDNKKF